MDLVDLGITAGAAYPLLQFNSVIGFGASDFHVSGLAGTVLLLGDGLAFTAAAVPEPATAMLGLLGLLGLSTLAGARRCQGLRCGIPLPCTPHR